MIVRWCGGPLDGAEDEFPNGLSLLNAWIGPDPTAPMEKVIVYTLFTDGDDREYRYSQSLTDRANAYVKAKRS